MSENAKAAQELIVTPEKIKARQGDFQIILNNKGNSANTYQLKADDLADCATTALIRKP